MKKITEFVKREEDKNVLMDKFGKKMGKKIIEMSNKYEGKISSLDTSGVSRILAAIIYELAEYEKEEGCQELLFRWMFERYYGKIFETRAIPLFEQCWEIFDRLKITRKNPIVYGDIDYSFWIEYPKEQFRKVILSVCHCAAYNANSRLFIYEKSDYGFSKFHIRAAYPRQKKDLYGIEKPSIKSYRDNDFETIKYGDCRDVLYNGSYEQFFQKVDCADGYLKEIDNALFTLKCIADATKEADENK